MKKFTYSLLASLLSISVLSADIPNRDGDKKISQTPITLNQAAPYSLAVDPDPILFFDQTKKSEIGSRYHDLLFDSREHTNLSELVTLINESRTGKVKVELAKGKNIPLSDKDIALYTKLKDHDNIGLAICDPVTLECPAYKDTKNVVYPASVSKIFVVAAYYNSSFKFNSTAYEYFFRMLSLSKNRPWQILRGFTRNIPKDEVQQKQYIMIHEFMESNGYIIDGNDPVADSNETMKIDSIIKFYFDLYNNNLQGSDEILELASYTATGLDRIPKHTSSDCILSGKTGTWRNYALDTRLVFDPADNKSMIVIVYTDRKDYFSYLGAIAGSLLNEVDHCVPSL